MSKMKMSLLNRMLLPIAPTLACCRENAVRYARSMYSAADVGPRSAGWTVANPSGEAANRGERDIVRARARDLERNSDILGAAILALERNVIGTGMVLQAKVLNADGKEDDAVNNQIEERWQEWCRPEKCEITGRFSFTEVCSVIVRRRMIDGGILIVKAFDSKQFRLQLLEIDDLDTTVQVFGRNRVIGGVEVDSYRRAVAYHIKIYDAWGFSIRTQRVKAENVIYLPYLTRPSQIREFSQVASSIPRIDDADELIDSAVEKERILSHLSVVIENAKGTLTGMPELGRGFGGRSARAPEPKSQAPQEILEQGTITYLKDGEVLKTVSTAGTSSTVDPILKTTQRLSGGAMGLSYEVSARDMSQVNYSSARQGLLEDQRTYKMLQGYLITHFCDVVFRDWLEWEALSGRLNLPGYFENPQKYQRHVWIACGWDWIDPVKEANANAKALETNQTTLQKICASRGEDYRDIIKQRKLEQELIGGKPVELEDNTAKDEIPDKTESAAAGVAADGDSIQSISLNGAQLDSLVEIVTLVVTGQFPYESAVALLTSAFPFDEATAKKILNDGKQIEIKKEDETSDKKGEAK